MSSVFVYCSRSVRTEKQKVQNDLLWYDAERKEMITFKGGKLNFVYDYDDEIGKRRLLPKVEDIDKYVTKVSIDKDASLMLHMFMLDEEDTGVTIIDENEIEGWIECDVPDEQLETFKEKLEENGFDFQVY